MKVTGNTLIKMGYQPAPWFKDALAELQAQDYNARAVLKIAQSHHAEWSRSVADELQGIAGVVTEQNDGLAPATIRGDHDFGTIDQLYACMKYGNVDGGALCADGHLGYAQPVGGVIAYKDQISVSGVGFDIGCGNFAHRIDLKYSDYEKEDLEELADKIAAQISFGVGRTNNNKAEWDLFDVPEYWKRGGVEKFKDLAVAQLGTVGGGNHYVNVMRDHEDYFWIAVHFGSRGFGHKTAKMFLERAGGKDGIHAAPTVLDVHSDLGQQYINAMRLAGLYAERGRGYVVDQVRKIMGAGWRRESVHNHHNFAWEENHEGDTLWVVRKGATPLFPGQQGFVGSSMGGDAFIVEGVESDAAEDMYYSTVHGSGRLYSRKFAKENISREEMDEAIAKSGVILRGGDVDESPMVYRDLAEVLLQQNAYGKTLKAVWQLKPVISVMAGANVKDPYKD